MRIVFTGGGTGGHFYPILAVLREIKRIAEEERILNLQFYYLGPEETRPKELDQEGVYFLHIPAGKIRSYAPIANMLDFVRTFFGVLRAVWNMFFIMPDVVFSKGGYGSFPTILAARIFFIPVIIHESDAIPGRVNRWAGKFAARVAVSFPSAATYFPPGKIALTGNPIRKRLLYGNTDTAREILGIASSRPVLFVTGASQGAQIINRSVIEILKPLAERYEIVHQAGIAHREEVFLETRPILENGGKEYYHLFGVLDEEEMSVALTLATVGVSRAGSSIFEFAARGIPSILIPLKIAASDHQRKNAYEYAETGAALVIEEDNLTPSVLLHTIQELMASADRRAAMSVEARAFAKTDAAEVIGREILVIGLH